MRIVGRPEFTVQQVRDLRNMLFRLLWSSIALNTEITQTLERLTTLGAAPDSADVASIKDRLHGIFNVYTTLGKNRLWQDAEAADDDDPE